jgi:3-oxoacyl-[acyl-carrier-protein] synthase-1
MPITPIPITAYTLTTALGVGNDAQTAALQTGRSGLRPCDLKGVELQTWIGRVDSLEQVDLPASHLDYDCRNNRLAYLALRQDGFDTAVNQAVARYGPGRVGLFLGTSTSGIAAVEEAYQRMDPQVRQLPRDFDITKTHNMFSAVAFLRSLFGLQGPALAIATACASSAKVFAAAHRYLSTGLCDAALVGGVDSLCLTTLYGFSSLELVSDQPCRPWDAERRGISIGEAAGFALLEKCSESHDTPMLLGYGESSDAYHMSTPPADGAGAVLAIEQALKRAGLTPDRVDYINLHGTATRNNDAAEDHAVVTLFGDNVACSSTKGFTGHTLGAAGISEAIFSLITLRDGFMPQTLQTLHPDPQLHANVLLQPEFAVVERVLSNSFGFGGNNCSLLFGASA